MATGSVTGGRHRGRARRWVLAAALTALSTVASACSGAADGEAADRGREVVVMAASSLSDAIDQVFGSRTDVTAVMAGSSTLAAQLAAGAGADVLITANAATMDRATSDGSVQGEPIVIATNDLVLATAAGNPGGVAALADLARSDLLVGLCAVEVPCGALARQALDDAGLAPSVDTLEPNGRALVAKLSLGELDAGLVYRTDAAMAGLPTIDAPELHGHVNRYYIASVSADPKPAVREVIDAFTSPGGAGTEALHQQGFGPP